VRGVAERVAGGGAFKPASATMVAGAGFLDVFAGIGVHGEQRPTRSLSPFTVFITWVAVVSTPE